MKQRCQKTVRSSICAYQGLFLDLETGIAPGRKLEKRFLPYQDIRSVRGQNTLSPTPPSRCTAPHFKYFYLNIQDSHSQKLSEQGVHILGQQFPQLGGGGGDWDRKNPESSAFWRQFLGIPLITSINNEIRGQRTARC